MRKLSINEKKMLIAVSAVVILLIGLAAVVRAAPAPSMYFEPTPGSGTCSEETTIDLMANTNAASGSAYAWVHFDPTCVNITNVSYLDSPWQPVETPGWNRVDDHIVISTINTTGNGTPAGIHKVATLTVDCVGCNCTSDMGITRPEPIGVNAYNTTFTCSGAAPTPTPDERNGSTFTYTVTVYEGQSTTVVVNMTDFGNLKRGDTGEIVDSLTFTNDGDLVASVDAFFTTNVSNIFGMIGGANVIPGNEFSMGPDGSEVALTADGTAVYISDIGVGETVKYDAILHIPNDAAAGAYSGDVEVVYS